MQTFLPYPDFELSARLLDRQRLGKQRVEAMQILQALTGESKGWANHPATRMWEGHEKALAEYMGAMCKEWVKRGYKNTKCGSYLDTWWRLHGWRFHSCTDPDWNDYESEFHRRHRLKLVWKLPEHYLPLFTDIFEVPAEEPEYIWPDGNLQL